MDLTARPEQPTSTENEPRPGGPVDAMDALAASIVDSDRDDVASAAPEQLALASADGVAIRDLTPLALLEDRIGTALETGRSADIEVGVCLTEIRDRALYADHGTFEAYCSERWGISRAHAYRKIHAARVERVLSPTGDTPRNEAQARALARITDDEQLIAVWTTIVETEPRITAEVVARHVDRAIGARPGQREPSFSSHSRRRKARTQEFLRRLSAIEELAALADFDDDVRLPPSKAPRAVERIDGAIEFLSAVRSRLADDEVEDE